MPLSEYAHAWARRPSHARHGTVLIVTIIISFALAGSVVALCRSMRVEMQASANVAASTEAAAVERGAEQYVLSLLANYKDQIRSMGEDEFAAVPVGRGYFWLLRPDYDDATLPVFGLIEESAKLNLIEADYDEMIRLPGMTYEAASSVMDWIDEDSNVERDGAENEYYLSLDEPYYCKNDDFEHVEELLLVRGVTRPMLYGDGTAPPLGERYSNRGTGRNLFSDPQLARGIYDLVTVYTSEPNRTTDDGQQRINLDDFERSNVRQRFRERLQMRGFAAQRINEIMNAAGNNDLDNAFDLYFRAKLKPEELDLIQDDVTHDNDRRLRRRLNVNAAPPAVLRAIEGLDEEDCEKLIAARAGNDPTSDSIAWVADTLGRDKAVEIGERVTWKTYQYSADILAVSGNGRAFKRVRLVIDTADGTPQVIYRRDITDRGWPMDPEILASIRRGEPMTSGARNVLPTRGGGGGGGMTGSRF
jgi:type II secretory pathway component PulK